MPEEHENVVRLHEVPLKPECQNGQLFRRGFHLCRQISKTGEQKLNRGERNRHFLRPYAGMAKLAIALRCQRRECGFKPRCLLLSRFSSAGRASALQAEGPRFDPWNRDENSFPIRLGESTPLTRRPKGKRLVPVFGKCGHGVIGSIPVFQTGGAGSFPVVHFLPSWRNGSAAVS